MACADMTIKPRPLVISLVIITNNCFNDNLYIHNIANHCINNNYCVDIKERVCPVWAWISTKGVSCVGGDKYILGVGMAVGLV